MADLVIDRIEKKYTLRDKYFPLVEKSMPKMGREFSKYIAHYRDKNSATLSSPYFLNYPVFSVSDKNIVFTTAGVNEDEMSDTIKVIVDQMKKDLGIASKDNFTPISTTLLMIVKYYLDNNKQEQMEEVCHYIGYSIYWSIFSKFFKHFLPRKETVYYTVNQLSNKFILKQLGSIDELLFYTINQTIIKYKTRIQRMSDAEIYYVIDAMKTRLNNYFRKIRNEYDINDRKKLVQYESVEQTDEGEAVYRSSTTGDVEALSQQYASKFFGVNPMTKYIKLASRLATVSDNDVTDTLNYILKNNLVDDVQLFYASIFYTFLNDTEGVSTEDIKSIKFFTTMDSIYKRGNSNNKNMISAKNLLDKWLKGGSVTYQSTNRQATINNYRRAVYYYLVLVVSSNKD